MARVSVIIPAFNAEASLSEAVRSIEAQTYDDWDLVVVDDGSTDRTAEIARGFGPRVDVAGHRANLGQAAARNSGIARSGGELLAFLDADDYWLPDYLAHQVRLFDSAQGRHADVGIVASNARVLGPDGFLPETHSELMGFPDGVTLGHLLRSNPIFSSVLSPRAVVEEAGGFCEELRGSEDIDLWIRIVERGYRVVATPRPLAVYRVGATTTSADLVAMSRNKQRTYRRALERGNLSWRHRRLVRQRLRWQRAYEAVCEIDAERRRRGGRQPYRRIARSLPLFATVAAEHPHRWPSGVRMLLRGGRGALWDARTTP